MPIPSPWDMSQSGVTMDSPGFTFDGGTVGGGGGGSVPDVEGLSIALAAIAIVAAGFTLGTITLAFSATVPFGLIISTMPAPGPGAPPGTPINLTVSQGPQPVQLLSTVNSYLYVEYQDDDDLWAFVEEFNQMTQDYLDWFNEVALPFYPGLSGDLLNWVGLGLYGLPRTALQASSIPASGMLNTQPLNQWPYVLNKFVPGVTTFTLLTDDMYQRILTWDFFKGDGKRFCMRWLKRRVMRFLLGVNGLDPEPWNSYVGCENTTPVSAAVIANVLTLNISQSTLSSLGAPLTPNILGVFKEAFEGRALDLPAQFAGFVCNIVP